MKRRNNILSLLVFVLLVLVQPGRGAQSNLFPTSPVVKIRDDTYMDANTTLYHSTPSVVLSTWTMVYSSSWTWIDGGQWINLSILNRSGTWYEMVQATWTLQQFLDWRDQDMKVEQILNVANDDMEIYMVWHDTSPPEGWKGWCLGTVNGKQIPVACP